MRRFSVLLITISIMLMLSGCGSQSGENPMPGTVSGRSGTGMTENGVTNSTSVGGTKESTQEQTKEQTEAQTQEQTKEQTKEQTQQQIKEQDKVADIEARVAETLSGMSTAEKIGQMFIIGFEGTEPGPGIKEMIRSRFISGVVLFDRNVKDPDQLLQLNNSLKQLNKGNKAPLLISVDEEGGRVSRMPDQLKDMPSALTVGNTGNSGYAYAAGGMLAGEIGAFGFNTDFAPVLDIWSNPQNTVIGDRAFGTTPETVSDMGISALKGIMDNGIIPVVKHFPGHGDTSVDSHIGLPVVIYDMSRLESFELVPFKAAIKDGADAVMAAHIVVDALDKKYPASLSKAVITDLLRKGMGFNGIIITDDMTMGAITKNYSVGSAAVKAIQAGCDIVLVCHGVDNQRLAMNSVIAAVKDGAIPVSRINESAARILRLKYKYGLTDNTIKSVNVDELNKKIEGLIAK